MIQGPPIEPDADRSRPPTHFSVVEVTCSFQTAAGWIGWPPLKCFTTLVPSLPWEEAVSLWFVLRSAVVISVEYLLRPVDR